MGFETITCGFEQALINAGKRFSFMCLLLHVIDTGNKQMLRYLKSSTQLSVKVIKILSFVGAVGFLTLIPPADIS